MSTKFADSAEFPVLPITSQVTLHRCAKLPVTNKDVFGELTKYLGF